MDGIMKVAVVGALLGGWAGSGLAQEGAETTRVVFTGDAGPRGETYGALTLGVIGDDSSLGLLGEALNLNSGRVWAGKRGAFSVVAAEDETAPGTGGLSFGDFGGLSINGAGNVSFFAELKSEGFQVGFFAVDAGGLVPTLDPDQPFAESPDLVLNGGGTPEYVLGNFLAVELELEDQANDNALTTVLATGRPGNLSVAFAEGDPAPVGFGLPGDLTFDRIFGDMAQSFNDPGAFLGFNADQEVIFAANVRADSADLFRTALYAGPVGALKMVAVTQVAAPGMGGAEYSGFGAPSVSSNGLIAFYADTETLFSSPEPPPPGAIFLGRPVEVSPIVKVGDPVPGGGAGVVFGSLSQPVVNSRGDVFFSAEIEYPNERRRPSVWVRRADEAPVLVAATGNSFATPDGLAEVTDVRFAGQSAFNDLNQAVFILSFGARDGLYVADVRSGYPVVRITSPARRSDQVTTRRATEIAGTAFDASGVARIDYEVVSRAEVKRGKNGEKRRRGRRKRVARSVNVGPDGTWSFRAPLRMGRNRVSVMATDRLGNASPSCDFTVIRWRGADGAEGRLAFRKLKRQVRVAH